MVLFALWNFAWVTFTSWEGGDGLRNYDVIRLYTSWVYELRNYDVIMLHTSRGKASRQFSGGENSVHGFWRALDTGRDLVFPHWSRCGLKVNDFVCQQVRLVLPASTILGVDSGSWKWMLYNFCNVHRIVWDRKVRRRERKVRRSPIPWCRGLKYTSLISRCRGPEHTSPIPWCLGLEHAGPFHDAMD